MIHDNAGGVTFDYYHLNLPRKITRSGGILVKYSYLADGSKASALKGNGEGLVYRSSLIYRRASDGTLSLESVAFAEGTLTPEGVHYHVTDHLGSVRAVVDGESGAFLEAGKYDAYGSREEQTTSTTSDTTLRWHFTGKEDQGPDFGTAYTDFGARQYSPSLRRWLVPDPLSEKYYDVSPYVYCNDNPVNMVDKDGRNPIAGAMLGAGLDIGIQLATNWIKGEKWYKIDGKSVAISAGAGALGAGLVSKIKQAKALIDLGKAATAASEVMAEAAVSGMESVAKQYVSEGTVSLEQTVTDVAIGAAASRAGQVLKNKTRASISGRSELKTLERRLNHAERVAGENPRSSRQSEVEKARAAAENVGDKEKQLATWATATALTVGDYLDDEKN